MKQDIYLIGLNHRSASVDIREQFALSNVDSFEKDLLNGPIREALVLSTCNRVEILAVGDVDSPVDETVLNSWAGICEKDVELLRPHVYNFRNDKAIHHLFTVAASLDSMVLGEPQILGQLKEAYRSAVENNTARVIVNRLLHKAFFVAKRVRTETDIASSAVSISYAAVELAKKIFGELEGKRAMLVGAGEMAELAALNLINGGISRIYVANRTFSRAQELADRFQGTPLQFEELYDNLPNVDIVISSTGATATVLHARDIRSVLKKRKNSPMFFIDIAVPRDIDPDVNMLDNVYLYDIDDLKDVVEENLAQRREEAERARNIIDLETASFKDWLYAFDLHPTIRDLLATGESIAEKELAKTLKRLGPDVDENTREALEALVGPMVQKLYHQPISFLKRRATEEGSAERFIDLARRMFNLDDDPVQPEAHLERRQTANRPARTSPPQHCTYEDEN